MTRSKPIGGLIEGAREATSEFKALRPYFYGDFHPLTEHSTSDEAWAAFQRDRPEQGDGIVPVLPRPQAAQSSITVQVHNLKAEANHEVVFDDYGLAAVKSGRERANGLAIKIPDAPGSLLLKCCHTP